MDAIPNPIDPTSGPDPEPSPPPTRQAIASRLNGSRSNGPCTPQGKERSRKNSWKHGMRAETIVEESELKAVDKSLARYNEDLRPECHVEADLVRMAAVAAARKLRSERAEQAALIPNAASAVRKWEERRRKAIRRRAQDLHRDPSGVLDDLLGSSFGCDWLAGRWSRLDRPIALGLSWGPDDLRDALALLGLAAEDQDDDPLAAEVRRLADDAPACEHSRDRLRALIAGEVDRIDRIGDEAEQAVDLPEREAVRLAALADTGKEGQLRQRYDRDAELSTHRNINLLLRLRRDEARLEYRAQKLAGAAIIPRAPVGDGWWREPNAADAPPGFMPIPAPGASAPDGSAIDLPDEAPVALPPDRDRHPASSSRPAAATTPPSPSHRPAANAGHPAPNEPIFAGDIPADNRHNTLPQNQNGPDTRPRRPLDRRRTVPDPDAPGPGRFASPSPPPRPDRASLVDRARSEHPAGTPGTPPPIPRERGSGWPDDG